ncbi:MAG: DUF3488 domain-containing transglutaminase family protein [Granulosicoccus sp.]|nr:DUF3488 domain-containing transglutaminase family protein [Granulosicoccus sp.]
MKPQRIRSLRVLRRLLPDMGQMPRASLDARTLYALATLLLLVQIPHLLHLPAWVSLSAATLVGLRLMLLRKPDVRWLTPLLSPISLTLMATASAVFIKLDFGYFIGRDPSVAFLYILVAAKFAEIRRPSDATLLLCLAAFLLLTQYFYSQTILAALITLPAVLALAYALAILRDPANPARTPEQLKLAGVLLLQGLPLAALLFAVFPRLPGPLWSLPEDAMARTGLSDSMSPGSIGQLSQSDEVAFRVEFDGPVPSPDQRYWRGPVLSEFDGRHWSASPLRLETTPSFRGNPDSIVDYTVMLQPHQQRWLFALDAAVSLPRSFDAAADGTGNPAAGGQTENGSNPNAARRQSRVIGRLMSDGQMISGKPVSQVLRYRQSSVLLDSIRPARRPSDETLFLPGRNTRTIAFANELRQSLDSDLAYAQAILDHFHREPFHYTLRPQLLGDTPVDEFLFDTRAGFCEHYAAAFVVLMRGAGIPARVVTGYLGGEMNRDYMIVRQSDAHAWTEAFIEGTWRRFDPTGAVAPSRVEQGLAAALPGESFVPRLSRRQAGWIRDAQLRWDALNHGWQRLVVDFDNDSQDKLWDRLGLATPALWQITVIVLLLAATWCAVVLGLPGMGRSKPPPIERLWQRLCRVLGTHRLARAANESTSEYRARACARWPGQATRLEGLFRDFDSLRFQPLEVDRQLARLRGVRRELRRLEWALLLQSR